MRETKIKKNDLNYMLRCAYLNGSLTQEEIAKYARLFNTKKMVLLKEHNITIYPNLPLTDTNGHEIPKNVKVKKGKLI